MGELKCVSGPFPGRVRRSPFTRIRGLESRSRLFWLRPARLSPNRCLAGGPASALLTEIKPEFPFRGLRNGIKKDSVIISFCLLTVLA